MPRGNHRKSHRQQMEIAYLLRNLIYNGEQRFTDFVKSIPGISKKVLTDDLRSLENDGLVNREVFAEIPPKVVETDS